MKHTDNVGSLSRNKRKETEKQPPYTGSAIIEGKAYWVSAFINESKENGQKYFRLYYKAKEGVAAAATPASTNPNDIEGPDIPF